jgi:hypothetical protein
VKNCSTVAGILGLLAMTGVFLLRQDAATGGENPPPAGSTLVGWGANDLGETDVPDGDFAAIAGGELYSLALRADGSLAGWGFNQFGQTDVPAGNDFVAVSAGFAHGLALRADGSLAGWGGQAHVPHGSFVAIAAGGAHSLAVRDDGSLVGWGGWSWFGETNVPPGNDFVAVAAGYFHSLALRADGSLVGWGSNMYGETNVPAGNDFIGVTAGYFHSLALRADGSLVGWGLNDDGQADVPEGIGFVAVAAGYAHSLALRIDGSLVGWGSNQFGATDVPQGNDFVAVAAGAAHSLAIRSSNTPPVVQVATDVTTLWPANLAMVPVTITTTVQSGSAQPEDLLVFCWVSSSQPDNTTGSRRHAGDVDGRDGFTTPVAIDLEHVGQDRYEATIRLRAERDGKDKNGRVYSILVEAWSPSGLSSSAVCSVHVPHNQGKGAGN